MTTKTGLVLTGGGARAAYQVGVLLALHEMGQQHLLPKNPFQIICGTSAGAINAAVLASRADDFANAVDTLNQVWGQFRVDQVYKSELSDMLGAGARWLSLFSLGWWLRMREFRPRSLLNNQPLAELMQQHIPLNRVNSLIAQGSLDAFAITASSYSTGEHVTFYQSRQAVRPWVRTQRLALQTEITHAHLLASSSIPFIFPPVPLNTSQGFGYFGDGAMRQTAPLSPAIHLGADRILAIGVGRSSETKSALATPGANAADPSLAQVAGHALTTIFLDTLLADIERMQRLNQLLQGVNLASQAAGTHYRPIDVLHLSPSESLDEIASRHARALPASVRLLLKIMGEDVNSPAGQGRVLVSYLLFDAGFTRELIALGKKDAWAQQKQLVEFFSEN